MVDTSTATAVPQFSGARASRDYATRAALESRQAIQRVIKGGIRRHVDIAAALNELGTPSPGGRPWNAGSVGRRLKRLGISGEATAQRDAEALRDQIEDLWARFVRTPPQLAVALNRRRVPCFGGGQWTAGKVGPLLRLLGGDWMTESAGRLQRGDAVPLEMAQTDELFEVTGMGEAADQDEAIEVPTAPEAIEAAAPIELPPRGATPRRRAIRA